MYNCRKKQNNAENRLKLLEFELDECKNKMKTLILLMIRTCQNLIELSKKFLKHLSIKIKKTMRYSDLFRRLHLKMPIVSYMISKWL